MKSKEIINKGTYEINPNDQVQTKQIQKFILELSKANELYKPNLLKKIK